MRHSSGDDALAEYLYQLVEAEHRRVGASVASGTTRAASSSGSSRKAIAQFEFAIPPLDEQRAIARVLGALDDKIELNRRMSATLEAMARALFKSWFVDFEPVRAKLEGRPSGLPPALDALFPASFEASELGQIPSGWGVGTLGDDFQIAMGQSRPGETQYRQTGDGLPFYQGRTDFGFRFPRQVGVYCMMPRRG